MWCNFTFVRVKSTFFKNDYDNDDDEFKKLDPRRAELAGKNLLKKHMGTTLASNEHEIAADDKFPISYSNS